MGQRNDSVATLSIRFRASTPKLYVLRGDGVPGKKLAQKWPLSTLYERSLLKQEAQRCSMSPI
jgi:hypothetical protein